VNRAIAWFAENHVAANLLMMAIIIAGLLSAPYIKQSVWPDFEINYVSATVVYPGASPEDVEKSVTIRIEEEIEGVEGIVDVTSSANEGATNVSVELEDGADLGRALDHIEARIDGITTLPKETEEPVVSDVKFSGQVLDIAIYGAADERTLTRIGQKVRDDIAKLPGVTNVELAAVRPYEISIEVSERELQRRGLRFDDVVLAIRRSSLDLPGGSVKTQAGEILLRTEGQAYRRVEFERIPLLTARDGSRVTVGDVAEVKDGFEETGKYARFDGQPAVFVQVFRVGDQQALEIAARVRAYIETARLWLPAGITLTVWDDDSLYLADRIGMMLRNAAGGFVLVLVLLAVFLKLRVAFWVAMGVPVSVCGALALMSPLGIDINILTVFSFIMALGILVDDAIVTGENIYTHQERQPGDPLGASIRGTQEVATPVVFGVLTTIAAFAPFTMVGGHARFMALGISGVMMVALGFSLVESKLVLPSHLAHFGGGPPPRRRISKAWARFQSRVAKRLRAFTEGVYGPAVRACVEWRYLTAAVSFGCFIVCLSLAQSGHVKSSMAPTMQADSVRAQLTMPLGTPTEQTEGAVAQLEAAAVRLTRELDEMSEPEEPSMLLHTLTTLGQHHGTSVASGRRVATGRTHLGQVTLELSASEERSLTASDIAGLGHRGSLARAHRLDPGRRRDHLRRRIQTLRRSDQRRAGGRRPRRAPGGGGRRDRGAVRLPRGLRHPRLESRRQAPAQARHPARGRGPGADSRGSRTSGASGFLRRRGPAHSAWSRRVEGDGAPASRRAALTRRRREHAHPASRRLVGAVSLGGAGRVRSGGGLDPAAKSLPPGQRDRRHRRRRRQCQ